MSSAAGFSVKATTPIHSGYVIDMVEAEMCDQYAVWFEERVKAGDALVMNELRRLYKIAKRGELVLGCYCAPKRCHGETIKGFLEKHL